MSVDVDIVYDGTEQGAQQLDQLVQRLDGVTAAEGRATAATERLEHAIEAEGQAAAVTRQQVAAAATSHAQFAQATQVAQRDVVQATNRLGQMSSAMGNVGAAVAGLSPQLGAFGSALGAVGGASSALVGSFGPVGVAIAGVTAAIGLAIPLYNALTSEMDENAAAAQNAERSVRDLAEAYREWNEEQGRLAGIGSAGGIQTAVDETTAALAQARRELAQRQDAIRQQVIEEHGSDQPFELRRPGQRQGQGVTMDPLGEATRRDSELRRLERRVAELQGDLELQQQGLDLARAAEEEGTGRQPLFQRDVDEAVGGRDFSRRRGGGARQRAPETDFFAAADVENELAMIERAREIEDEVRVARASAHEERMAQEEEFAQVRIERLEEFKEKQREEEELALEALEKQKEAIRRADEERAAGMEEVRGVIESTLQNAARAYVDLFGVALEGQEDVGDASVAATKQLLKGLGEEMVAIGIRESIEGVANVVSNPPIFATKVPAGVALIAAGVGLGAASAAIPSAGSAPAEPRQDEDRGGDSGPITLVINNNAPLVSTGTHAQLARELRRQVRGGEIPQRRAA